MRQLTYAQAIREAHAQLLREDPRVFICGQGVWNPWYAGKSLQDLDREFGRERVFDCPVSENATTGAAIGAAIVGMRPIVFHARMDFMLLAMDPIVNQAANWSYLFGGQVNVPVVIRTVINRGGEQGAQHSQALQALFAHVPGLKVVMPSTPYDAKGLLIAAVRDGNPVLYIDDRWLYELTDDVPEEMYEVSIGTAARRRTGKDVTLVATSYMAAEAVKAAEITCVAWRRCRVHRSSVHQAMGSRADLFFNRQNRPIGDCGCRVGDRRDCGGHCGSGRRRSISCAEGADPSCLPS